MRGTKDMTWGSPFGLILSFALPVLLGNLLQQAYSLADTVIIGRSDGVAALAAVSAAGWLDFMVLGTVIGLCQGFSVRVSHCFGARDAGGLRLAVGQSMTLGAAAAVLLLVLSQALLRPALTALQTPPETFGLTLRYLRVLFAGIPVVTAYNLLAGCLRAAGNSRVPMLAVVGAAACNIALDLLFVAVLRMGVLGAALATVMSQAVSLAVCLRAYLRLEELRPERAHLRPRRDESRRLLLLGVPMALQTVVISVGGLVLNGVVNTFGYVFMAGYNAPGKLQGMMESAGMALGSAVSVYTGQNSGAGRMDRVRSGVRVSAAAAVFMALCVAVLMALFGREIMLLFVRDEEALVERVLEIGCRFLLVMSAGLAPLYILFVYRSALQGLGEMRTPMYSALVELVMRVGCALLLPGLMGEWGVYLAEVFAWVGAAVLLVCSYLAGTRAKKDGPGPS